MTKYKTNQRANGRVRERGRQRDRDQENHLLDKIPFNCCTVVCTIYIFIYADKCKRDARAAVRTDPADLLMIIMTCVFC